MVSQKAAIAIQIPTIFIHDQGSESSNKPTNTEITTDILLATTVKETPIFCVETPNTKKVSMNDAPVAIDISNQLSEEKLIF